jgi:hypothetical protein
MTKKENEVAVVEKKAMIVAPSFMDADDFGGGFEGADADSFAIPFFQVLQKMSPLVDENHASYIEGAKAGQFFNTVTRRLYDGKAGVVLVPCAFKRSFVQWGARDEGGGFKGEFSPEQIDAMLGDESSGLVAVDGSIFKKLADGTVDAKKCDYFADTRSHYVITIDPESGETMRAIFAITGTLTKASRMLMTSLQQKKVQGPRGLATPPSYANLVKVVTNGMKNDKGSWSGIVFELQGLVTDINLYAEAKEFYRSVVSGETKADYSKAEQAAAPQEAGNTPQEAEGF